MRHLSTAFVERTLERMQKKGEEVRDACPALPDAIVEGPYYQRVRAVINNRGDWSRVHGFWMGYSLGLGAIQLSEMAEHVAKEMQARGFSVGAIEVEALASQLKRENK